MLTLSTQTQEEIARAVGVLAAPFDHESPEAWLTEVDASLRTATGAVKSALLVPRESGIEMSSAYYSPETLRSYLTFFPLLEQTGGFQRSLQYGVATRRQFYGPHYEAMQRTEYVQEFLPSIRSFDSITMVVPWVDRPADSTEVFQVLLNVDDPRQPFSEGQAAVARMLYPALQAGLAVYRQFAAAHANLGALIDAVGGACAVFDLGGRLLHTSPALADALAAEPCRERLMERAGRLARAFASGSALPQQAAAPVTVEGTRGQYVLAPSRVNTLGPRPLVVVAVERPTRAERPEPETLCERLGLTPRQAEVALLLAERRTNREIAAALCISPHTVRHHTEGVLRALGLSDRRDVAAAVRGAQASD